MQWDKLENLEINPYTYEQLSTVVPGQFNGGKNSLLNKCAETDG